MSIIPNRTSVPDRFKRTSSDEPPSLHAGGLDWWLIFLTVGLVAFGIITMHSTTALMASEIHGSPYYFVIRQLMGVGLGVFFGFVLLRTPWATLRRASPWIYGAIIVLLFLVYVPGIGSTVKGASRWLRLGPLNLQPSAYAKLALILVYSDFLARHEGRLGDLRTIALGSLGWIGPMAALIYFEPDFGNTAILIGLAGLLLILAGLRLRWIALLGGLAGAALSVLAIAEPYRMRRLTSFWDPMADVEGDGYQVVQGWIALASGFVFGRGVGTGVGQRGFLPEAHTDFVSAVVGEEWGAVGWLFLLLAYLTILYRGTVIASRAPDLFGTLVGMGCTALLGVQVLINLGMVTGMTPAKGAVLPFMSFGASEVVVHVLCIALLIRIGLESHRSVLSNYKSPGGGSVSRSRVPPATGSWSSGPTAAMSEENADVSR